MSSILCACPGALRSTHGASRGSPRDLWGPGPISGAQRVVLQAAHGAPWAIDLSRGDTQGTPRRPQVAFGIPRRAPRERSMAIDLPREATQGIPRTKETISLQNLFDPQTQKKTISLQKLFAPQGRKRIISLQNLIDPQILKRTISLQNLFGPQGQK